jgi:hypothetical protein
MNFVAWNSLLFAFKWVLILFIYIVLFIIVAAVRREMSLRIGAKQPAPAVISGRLKVVRKGSDPNLDNGAVLLLQAENRIGAAMDNDIILGDQYISSHHARLRLDGNGWWIEDLGSRNGTFINGSRCPPHMPRQAPAGATLEMGDMAFQILEKS